MTVFAELGLRVDHQATPGLPDLDAIVRHDGDGGSPLDLVLDLLDPSGALRPGAGTVQVVTARLTVDREPAPQVLTFGELSGGFEVESTQRQGTLWRIELPAHRGDFGPGALAYERQLHAPPPGLVPVHLDLVYLLADADAPYRVLAAGQSVEAERTVDDQGHRLALTGLGREGRFDRRRVTLQLPPHHGLTPGDIVRRLALEAGVPETEIDVGPFGPPLGKALDMIDEEWLPVARDAALAVGHDVVWNRQGRLELRPLIPEGGQPVATFTVANITQADGIRVTAASEVPTCVVVTGRAPGPPAGQGGLVTTVEDVVTYDTFQVPGAVAQQDTTSGAMLLVAQPGPLPAKFQIRERTRTVRVERGGCPEVEEVIRWEWFAPEVARYQLGPDGQPAVYAYGFVYQAAEADDSAPLYAWPFHRFVETSRLRTVYRRDDRGRLVAQPAFHAGWLNPEAAVKQRTDATQPWEAVPFEEVRVTGNRRGVLLEGELYFRGPRYPLPVGAQLAIDPGARTADAWLRVEDVTFNLTDDNFKTAEDAPVTAWGLPEGDAYLYTGGGESSYPHQASYRGESRRTLYHVVEGEGGHREIEQRFDAEGRVLWQQSRAGNGYLPAAEIWDADLADRSAAVSIEAKVCALEDVHPHHEERLDNDFVETLAQASALAELILRDRSATEVTFAVPVDASLDTGQPVALDLPRLGLVGEGWIRRVVHAMDGPGAPMLTRVTVALPEV